MKKRVSIFLILTVALAMVFTVPSFVLTASAEGSVAAVIDTDGVTEVGQFETFAAAYEAATEGQTIKLLGAVTAAEAVALTKTVTIDGNGQTYTFTGAGDATNKVFTAAFKAETADVTTTIKNITVTATGEWAAAISVANGTVVLESGTYTAAGTTALYVEGGVVTVGVEGAENSTVNLTACAGNPYGVMYVTGGNVTVNCATVRSSHTSSTGNDNSRLLLAQGSSTVHIKNADMQVTSANGAGTVLWTEGTNVTLTIDNGTYVQTGGGRMLDPRSGAKKITINGGTFAVNGGYFGRLAGAFDIEINGGTFTQSGSGNFFNFTGGSSVEKLTINGGTFTTGGGAIIYANGANVAVTITKGTFTNNANNGNGFAVHGGATLTIDPANDSDVVFDIHRYTIQGSAGTINIKGGTFITAGAGNAALMNTDGAYTVNIEGGIYTYNGSYYALNVTAAGTVLNINGGTITAPNGHGLTAGAGTTLNIAGGTTITANGVGVSFAGTTLNISGGTIAAGNNYGVYIGPAAETVNITGGTISASVANKPGLRVDGGNVTVGTVGAANSTVNITGNAQNGTGAIHVTAGTLIINCGTFRSSHTSAATNGADNAAIFYLQGTANVHIKNADIQVTSGNSAGTLFWIHSQSASLTIDNGTYVQTGGGRVLDPRNGAKKITINDGTFTINGGFFGRMDENLELEINGGTFTQSGSSNMLAYAGSAKTVKITINGGTFTAGGGAILPAQGAKVEILITKGTFTNNANNGNGFTVHNGATITIDPANDSDVVFDIHRYTIQGSAGTINIKGGTFTTAGYNNAQLLNTDGAYTVNIDGGIFTYNGTYIALNVTAAGAALNINGGTFTAAGGVIIYAGNANATLNIKAGNFTNKAGNGFGVHNGATLTIDPANDADVVFNVPNYVIQGSGGTITIKGGTFNKTGTGAQRLMNDDGAYTVNIEGGIFNYNGSYYAFEVDNAGTVLNINGGTINAPRGHGINAAAGTTVNITGGTITANGVGIGFSGVALNISGGSIAAGNNYGVYIGPAAETVNITGGTISASVANIPGLRVDGGNVTVGTVGAANSTVNITGNAQNGTGAIHVTGGTLIINCGTFRSSHTSAATGGADNAAIFYLLGTANVHIKNADIQVTSGNSAGTLFWIHSQSASLTIDNGTFTMNGGGRMFDPRNGAKKITINDGTFTINGGYFVRMDENLELEINGGTFTQVSNSNMFGFAGTAKTVNVTITGGAFNLTSTDAYIININNGTAVTVNITGGTFINNANSAHGFTVQKDTAKLIIDPAQGKEVLVDVARYGINISAGTLTIKGGTIKTLGLGNARTIIASGATTVNISGGNIIQNGTYNAVELSGSVICNISGGNFSSVNTTVYTIAGTVNITGGSFTSSNGTALQVEGGAVTVGTVGGNNADVTVTGKSKNGIGVIYAKAGTLIINCATVRSTHTSEAEGGADNSAILKVDGGSCTVNNGDFAIVEGNTAGTVLWGGGSEAIITVNGGSFVGLGGGRTIDIRATKNLTINGGTFTMNGSGYLGRLDGTPKILITGGDFVQYNANWGFIFKSASIDMTVEGGTFEGPEANTTWPIFYIEQAAKMTITDGTFNGNGGRLITGAGTVNIDGGTFTTANNFLTSSNATMTITGGTFEGPELFNANGPLTITGGTFTYDGGRFAIYAVAGLNISNGTFTGNGTNVINVGGGTAIITGGTFEGTGAKTNAIYSSTDLTITGGSFTSVGTVVSAEGLLNITGGIFVNTGVGSNTSSKAVEIKNGVANISGGYFEAASMYGTVSAVANVNADGKFASEEEKAAAKADADRKATAVLNIYAGTFVGKSANGVNGIAVGCANGDSEQCGTMNIYGGTFLTDLGVCARPDYGILNIYGGYFHNNRDAYIAPSNFGTTNVMPGGLQVFVQNSEEADMVDTDKTVVDSFYLNNGDTETTNIKTFNGIPMRYAGAAVRLTAGSPGLRFTSFIPQSVIDAAAALKDDETEITYGTLIIPTDLLRNAVAFTKEALEAAGVTALDIPATSNGMKNIEGGLQLRAAIVEIKEENYDRYFSAVPYVSYVVNGYTVTCYGVQNYGLAGDGSKSETFGYNADDVTVVDGENYGYGFERSVKRVATAALADTMQNWSDEHVAILKKFALVTE